MPKGYHSWDRHGVKGALRKKFFITSAEFWVQFRDSGSDRSVGESPPRERLTLIRILEELRGWGTRAATMPCDAKPRPWSEKRGAATAEDHVPLYWGLLTFEDSQTGCGVIQGYQMGGTFDPNRTVGPLMGIHRATLSRPGNRPRTNRARSPAVRGGSVVDCAHGLPVARPAG